MVDEHSFFWLPDDAVWSDIIGCEAALNALLDETDLAITDYYKTYEDTIHSYFHRSSFDHQLASILRAPPCELHPSVMYEEELSGPEYGAPLVSCSISFILSLGSIDRIQRIVRLPHQMPHLMASSSPTSL